MLVMFRQVLAAYFKITQSAQSKTDAKVFLFCIN